MKTQIYGNSIVRNPTKFPAALQLIEVARSTFNVSSENWPEPTDFTFGNSRDRYYAEIWLDGMDWQPSYWFIEYANPTFKPEIYPFAIFESHGDREKINRWDWNELCSACSFYRRDKSWIKHGDLGYYTDTIWPFVEINKNEKWSHHDTMIRCSINHASMEMVNFWINKKFIPNEYKKLRNQ